MSDKVEKTERGPLDLPRLKDDALEFAQTIMSIGLPYDYAVQAFLDSFPAYAEHETLSDEEIFQKMRKRFKEMRCSTRRISYHKIKETEATLKRLLDCIPVASPLVRLLEFEKMRQDPGLRNSERIKMLAAAARETEILTPRERQSPFTGLPNLIPRETSEPENQASTQENGAPAVDAFGGAMMNHANSGQETPEDS